MTHHCTECERIVSQVLVRLDENRAHLTWQCAACDLYWDLKGQPVSFAEAS